MEQDTVSSDPGNRLLAACGAGSTQGRLGGIGKAKAYLAQTQGQGRSDFSDMPLLGV